MGVELSLVGGVKATRVGLQAEGVAILAPPPGWRVSADRGGGGLVWWGLRRGAHIMNISSRLLGLLL